MRKFRCNFLFSLLMVLALLYLGTAQTQAQESFRVRADQEKVRIVVDVPSGAKYKDKTVAKNKIILEISGNNNTAPANQTLNDQLVQRISLSANGKIQALTVDLKQQGTYKVFALSAPERIVIDVFRTPSSESIKLPKGVEYKKWVDYSSGEAVDVYLLKLAPGKEYQLLPLLARGKIVGRAATQQILTDSIAGVNASYFDASGSIYGNTKVDGLIISAEEKLRTGLAMDPKLGYKVLQANYQGHVVLPDAKRLKITGVNRKAMYTDLIVYNDKYDATTHTDTSGVEVVVKNNKVEEVIHNTGNTPIPKGGYVLAAFGYNIYDLANLNPGDTVRLEQSLGEADSYKTFVGAGPLLVKNGKVEVNSRLEEFPRDISFGRAPRTAVGITKNKEILLIVADGRSARSAGFTLEQLAECLLRLGAQEAVNFDGGGSSTFVATGYVTNKPSDGAQRPVSLALAVRKVK